MSVGNNHICCLLIVLRQLKIIYYGLGSFIVICRWEWKGVGRNTVGVKIMKK
jgi:hypothetical protein